MICNKPLLRLVLKTFSIFLEKNQYFIPLNTNILAPRKILKYKALPLCYTSNHIEVLCFYNTKKLVNEHRR